MKVFKAIGAALAVAMLAGLFSLIAAPAASASDDYTYEVTITNTMQRQYLTPPNWAAHSNSVEIFDRGEYASAGIEAVAERGEVPVLAAEIRGLVDDRNRGVSGVAGDGPLAPGESVTFQFTTDESRFTAVSMIVCTNDAFGGRDGVRLPTSDGQVRTYELSDFDAGTEQNTENREDIVPAPFCDYNNVQGSGADQPEISERKRIARHVSHQGNGDQPRDFDWTRGEVADITITRLPAEPQPRTYELTLVNQTDGQYLTPPNWAAHDRAYDLFERGQQASPGVEAVAETGGVPILAAEIAASVDNQGLGVSGVAASDNNGSGPIGPGETRSWEFQTEDDYLTILSMIICTNDGFAGLDAQRLPTEVGDTKNYRLRDYDAGTEQNTENRADLVGAPFCSFGNNTQGNDADQPGIATNDSISRHRTLRGNGDQPADFDWRRGQIAYVSVTLVD